MDGCEEQRDCRAEILAPNGEVAEAVSVRISFTLTTADFLRFFFRGKFLQNPACE